MDVEFFIHGVPKGESFWGKSEEKNFLGQFYDGKKRFLNFDSFAIAAAE